jgi:hypothetical protein
METDPDHVNDEEFPMSGDEYEDSEGGESESENDSDDEEAEDSKWAAAMAKLLKQKEAPTLSKAKKDKEIEKKKEQPAFKFEIVSKEGVKSEKKDDEKPDDKKLAIELIKQKMIQRKERRKTVTSLRQLPSIGDYEREKTLKKVATKGCVQLFNAVRAQQKDINKKLNDAGKLESKRDKVMKNINRKEFLNALMSGPRAKSELVDNLVKDEQLKDEIKSESESEDEKSTWSALKPGFLTGKKSGWDKEESGDEAGEHDDSKMDDSE